MDKELIGLLGAVVGAGAAVIGGLITAGATFLHEELKSRRQAKNLAIAVASEAAAIAEVVRRRSWLEQVFQASLDASKGEVSRMTVQLPPEFLAVARQAQQSAGSLKGSLSALVPRLVIVADAAAADFDRLYRFPIDDPQSIIESDRPDDARDFYAELAAVLAATLQACDEVVHEAKRLYPKETARLLITRTQVEVITFPKGV
jgi:hypothetical protein